MCEAPHAVVIEEHYNHLKMVIFEYSRVFSAESISLSGLRSSVRHHPCTHRAAEALSNVQLSRVWDHGITVVRMCHKKEKKK